MNRPGQNIKTRTINVDGVIQELFNTLETRLKNTLEDWQDEEVLKDYLHQDFETYKGSIELMYKLDLIDNDRWTEEINKGYDLFFKMANETA